MGLNLLIELNSLMKSLLFAITIIIITIMTMRATGDRPKNIYSLFIQLIHIDNCCFVPTKNPINCDYINKRSNVYVAFSNLYYF